MNKPNFNCIDCSKSVFQSNSRCRACYYKNRLTLPEIRFFEKVELLEDCWIWKASTVSNNVRKLYGHFWNGKKLMLAHRWSYNFFIGEIPKNLTIDHLCGSPSCVNPGHMDLVPLIVNIRRGFLQNARKTHCKHGHEFTKENTYVDKKSHRRCRICDKQKQQHKRDILKWIKLNTLLSYKVEKLEARVAQRENKV